MSKKAPGKAHRRGLTLLQVADKFRNEASSLKWIEKWRWPHGPYCPHCGSFNVQDGIKHKTMTHRCRDCEKRPMFTVRVGTVMERTRMSYRTWAIGIYLFTTNIKGVSSMRLHRELGITQKTAWFMLQRLRKALESSRINQFSGPVEVDETFMGGKRANMSNAKHKELEGTGRGAVGKVAVVGVKDRESKQVSAKVVQSTDAATLIPFVESNAVEGSTIYSDDASAYHSLPTIFNDYRHESVKHSVKEYVRGQVHTNGVESFWSMLKRGYTGIYHKMSPKHLDRYVQEFAGRHNMRESDTVDQMGGVVVGMVGKRLQYKNLITDNGLLSGARQYE